MLLLKKAVRAGSLFCMGALVLSHVIFAQQSVTPSLKEVHDITALYDVVLDFITKGVAPDKIAIACDMDETLVTTDLVFDGKAIKFPQSRFFDFLKKELKGRNDGAGVPSTHDQRFNKANDLVTLLDAHGIIKTSYTEDQTQKVVQQLKDLGVHLFILTARPSFASARTERTLQSVGINFHPAFLKTTETVIDDSIGCLYKCGVLYAQKGKIRKGDAMVKLFDHHGYTPEVLIAIDDRTEYLEGIDDALDQTKTQYQGIWYRHAERWEIDDRSAERVLQLCFGPRWWSVAENLEFKHPQQMQRTAAGA